MIDARRNNQRVQKSRVTFDSFTTWRHGLLVTQLNAMLALGREPAADKSLRGYDDVLVLGDRHLQVLVDRLLGEATDNARRDQDSQGDDNQQNYYAFFHG